MFSPRFRQPHMSTFGITKGYSLFSVEHLMILTARGRHRKPIIDFPLQAQWRCVWRLWELYIIYFTVELDEKKTYITFSLDWTKTKTVSMNHDETNPVFLPRCDRFKWSHLTTLAEPPLHSAFVGFICVPPGVGVMHQVLVSMALTFLNHHRASVGVDTEARWKRAHRGGWGRGGAARPDYSHCSLKECVREKKHQKSEQVDGSHWLMFTMETGGNPEKQLAIFEPKQRFHGWKTGQLVIETMESIITAREPTVRSQRRHTFITNCMWKTLLVIIFEYFPPPKKLYNWRKPKKEVAFTFVSMQCSAV